MIINFLAGPGAGKSTLAAGLFYHLKLRGVNCELVQEYAKELCWEGKLEEVSPDVITEKQFDRVNRLWVKVPVIIHDTSLLLGAVYGQNLETCLQWDSQFRPAINIFVQRDESYNTQGRMQTKHESLGLDKEILYLLDSNNIPYTSWDKVGASLLANYIISKANL